MPKAKTNTNAKNNTSTIPSKRKVREIVKDVFEDAKVVSPSSQSDHAYNELIEERKQQVYAYLRHLEKQAGL